jgi:hypothetical protein
MVEHCVRVRVRVCVCARVHVRAHSYGNKMGSKYLSKPVLRSIVANGLDGKCRHVKGCNPTSRVTDGALHRRVPSVDHDNDSCAIGGDSRDNTELVSPSRVVARTVPVMVVWCVGRTWPGECGQNGCAQVIMMPTPLASSPGTCMQTTQTNKESKSLHQNTLAPFFFYSPNHGRLKETVDMFGWLRSSSTSACSNALVHLYGPAGLRGPRGAPSGLLSSGYLVASRVVDKAKVSFFSSRYLVASGMLVKRQGVASIENVRVGDSDESISGVESATHINRRLCLCTHK